MWLNSSISTVPVNPVLTLGFQLGAINCVTQRPLIGDVTQLNATLSPICECTGAERPPRHGFTATRRLLADLAGTNDALQSGLTNAAFNTSQVCARGKAAARSCGGGWVWGWRG